MPSPNARFYVGEHVKQITASEPSKGGVEFPRFGGHGFVRQLSRSL
jgi:hypothetical protein